MQHRSVETNRATYDEVAVAYAELNLELPQSVIESMDRFVAALPTEAVVADVGCGPCRDLTALRARGLTVLGFDLSIGMLRAGGTSGLVEADMTRLPIGSGTVDGVWCAAAFLHVPRELSSPTLAEFARVLRPGGALHLSVAEGEGDEIQQARLGRGSDLFVVHHQEDGLTEMLSVNGFLVKSVDRSESMRRWLTIEATLAGAAG